MEESRFFFKERELLFFSKRVAGVAFRKSRGRPLSVDPVERHLHPTLEYGIPGHANAHKYDAQAPDLSRGS